MIWPHDDTFPHRRRVLIGATGVSALIALVWPDLSIAQRLAAPCAVVLATALGFGFFYLFMRLIAVIPLVPDRFFLVYGYVLFYFGLLVAVVAPFMLPAILSEPEYSTPMMKALIVGTAVPIPLAVAAAAYNGMARERGVA